MSEQQVQSKGGERCIRVLVTGAAGQIAYSLIYMVANGEVFGKGQKMELLLLDITPMMGVMEGLKMELMDCAFPLVESIVSTDKEEVAFKDIDAALLVGAMPRKAGMERKDLLQANVKIFKSQGQALNNFAKKSVKVIVVGNPANTNAVICQKYAPDIPAENFTAMTRLDQNRARAQIAARCGVAVGDVKKVVIWGNHSSTQFPHVDAGEVTKNGKVTSVREAVKDDSWLNGDFIKTVQGRGAAVIKARGLSSAMSAAKACCDHMRDWWAGQTDQDDYTSMAVFSNGNPYKVPDDLIFSFPVTLTGQGKWEFVKNVTIDEFAQSKLDATAKELQEEKAMATTATN